MNTMPTDHTPHRIACLQPSATVILADLGQLEKVIACTKYCAAVCPEVADGHRAILADSWTAHTTEIVAAKPDLVIAAVPYQENAVSEILKSGARFLGLAPRTLSDIYTDIAVIAGTVGAPGRGVQIIAEMQGEIAAVRAQTRNLPRPRVFCEEWGRPLIASQPWVSELVDAAGGDFVGTPGVQTTADLIRAENPDVIVAAWCGAGERVPLEKITRDRGWETMRAVNTSRVFCIRDEFLNTPAPTLLRGLRALAAAIHPELFPQPPGLRSVTRV